MNIIVKEFLEQLKVRRLSPVRTAHLVNGRTMWWWHVDNDDDRFVTALDLPNNEALVLTFCDGKSASSVVMPVEVEAINWVERHLKKLAENSAQGTDQAGLKGDRL